MTDAALYHEELLDLERQVEAVIRDVDASYQQTAAGVSSSGSGGREGGYANSPSARAAAFAKAQDLLRRVNRLLQQLRAEMRLLDDAERDVYEAHASAHARKAELLRAQVQQSKERAARSTAVAVAAAVSESLASGPRNASASGASFRAVESVAGALWSPREGVDADVEGGEGPAMSSRAEARHAATRINALQHSTLQSLGLSERMLNETETVGNEAATKLRAQTEQIRQANDMLEEMHSELGRVSAELKRFMRQIARDRLIIFFAVTILVCIITIVVLEALKHRQK
ncbi:hypothetical protein LSCM1_05517 [Leishmania martiniquensis]|uniref:Sec20 C-terminal domain-containing protein n=1 Tax=Leishmania martiniquensis TaxID=1580590 RepID=A0A836GWM8_9TRYP|nr:hypothetical protein LSCM1_05517 [Leishmania martiniquensis]